MKRMVVSSVMIAIAVMALGAAEVKVNARFADGYRALFGEGVEMTTPEKHQQAIDAALNVLWKVGSDGNHTHMKRWARGYFNSLTIASRERSAVNRAIDVSEAASASGFWREVMRAWTEAVAVHEIPEVTREGRVREQLELLVVRVIFGSSN